MLCQFHFLTDILGGGYRVSSDLTGTLLVVIIMLILYSQVHVYPGHRLPCGEENGGHHENRVRHEDVRHTQNTHRLNTYTQNTHRLNTYTHRLNTYTLNTS